MGLLTGVLRGLADLVYPPECRRCEREIPPSGGLPLCDECRDDLHFLPKDRCPTCGKTIRNRPGSRTRCWECRSGFRRFDRAISVFVYDGTFRKLWHRVKFSNRPEWIAAIVDAALEHIGPDEDFNPYLFDVFTWAPTTDRRKAGRGVDLAEEIAKHLAEKYQRPVAGLLRRIRDCPPQAELSRRNRIENVKGAFSAAVPTGMRTRSVLLIDDILTTGSTASACADALKDRGFQKVVLFTLARGL